MLNPPKNNRTAQPSSRLASSHYMNCGKFRLLHIQNRLTLAAVGYASRSIYRMKRTTRTYAFLIAVFIVGAFGCSSRTSSEKMGSDYIAESEQVGKGTTVYRLYKTRGRQRRMVTEAIVEKGDIQSLLPTPFAWGCTSQGFQDSPLLATVYCGALGDTTPVMTVELHRDRTASINDHPCDMNSLTQRLDQVMAMEPTGVIVVETEIPVSFQCLYEVIVTATRREKLGGLVILPKLRNPAKPLVVLADDQPVANTNPTIKGLYGKRTSASQVRGSREAAVMDGLRALKSSQNEDGSWGSTERRCLATALVLTALLSHGEVESSHEFGLAVAKAHSWIMSSTPSNNAERIAMVAALSEYDVSHFGGRSRDLARREVARVKELIAGAVFRPDDPWTDYLTLHLTAPEVERPAETLRTPDYLARWKDRTADLEPTTITGYVALCASSLGKFIQGGKSWDAFNKSFVPRAVERQMKDGFWPAANQEDRFACSALAIEGMEVNYAFRKSYWPEPERQGETAKNQ